MTFTLLEVVLLCVGAVAISRAFDTARAAAVHAARLAALARTPVNKRELDEAVIAAAEELHVAVGEWGVGASSHEVWAVAWEELDELWDEVRKKRSARDPERMYKEAIQVAAVAMKFAVGSRYGFGRPKA